MARDYQAMLNVAFEQAKLGFEEGGVPVGAAMFDGNASLLSVDRISGTKIVAKLLAVAERQKWY